MLFTMLFAANAQVPILSENFDSGMPTTWTQIDANNDGYGWEHCSAPVSYFAAGADLSGSGHNSSAGFVLSGSYSNVTSTAITPDNWLITPATAIPTQGATLTFWVCAQDASYAAEHYGVYISTTTATATTSFTQLMEETIDANGGSRVQGTWKQKTVSLAAYAGQTVYIAFRHFNCNDEFVLNLDDVEITAAPTSPTIVANPTSIDFHNVLLTQTSTQQVAVAGYSLTAGISATVTAPFTVSADGNTFGATATLDTAGGTLYVKYAPTTVGADSSTVTLSSTGASVTIPVIGSGLDCSNITIPFTEGFEGSIDCWTMVSADASNDDKFGVYQDASAYAGSYDFRFSSFNSASDYNQYLITPELQLSANANYMLSFYYKAYTSSDYFRVSYSTTTNDVTSFTQIADYQTVSETWTEATVALPAGTKYVAINYYGDYAFYLYVDNISITELNVAPTVTIEGPANVTTGSAAQFVAVSPLADTFAWTVDGAAVPGTTDTLTYTFTTVGNHTVGVTATNSIGSATASHTVEAIACNPHTLPFTEDFNGDIMPPLCWSYIDAENFGIASVDADAGDYAIYFQNTDMLVSPELSSTEPMHVNFGYRSYLGNYGTSTFRVGHSSTNNSASSFTWLTPVSINAYPDDDVVFFDFNADIPANTKYVAIEVTELGNYAGAYDDVIYIDNFLVDNNVGINEHNENVSVYPNPANNVINVNASANINMVEVFNMMGQRVALIDANDTNVQINTTALSNGMYMMRITTEEGVSNQKFMVAR